MDDQAVGAQIMCAAGGRMPHQGQRHQRRHRPDHEQRCPRPAQHHPAGDRDPGSDEGHPAPGIHGFDLTRERPQLPGPEIAHRLTGHIGDRQRHHDRREHRKRSRCRGADAQRAVAVHVEHAGGLRWDEEGREQERADGNHGDDFGGRAHERQTVRGDGARVG